MKEAHGGEVVVVSFGPAKAIDSLRKALAMGADRALLVSDDAAAGSDLVATSYALAKALAREIADLVLFGQQSSDSDGAVFWAAVADRLRRPLISQVADLTVDGDSVTGKRQTEFGYDVIARAASRRRRRLGRDQRAALPVAEGDHGREVEAERDALARRHRRRARAGRRGRVTHDGDRVGAAAAQGNQIKSRTTAAPPSSSSPISPIGSCCDHARLPRASRRRAAERGARRAHEGRLARRRGGRRRCRRGRQGRRRERRCLRRDDGVRRRRPRVRGAAPSTPRRRARGRRAGVGSRERALRRIGPRRRHRRRSFGAPRRGPQLGPHRALARGRQPDGEAPGARRHGSRRRGVDDHPPDRARTLRSIRGWSSRAAPRRSRTSPSRFRTSPRARGWSSGPTSRRAALRSRMQR